MSESVTIRHFFIFVAGATAKSQRSGNADEAMRDQERVRSARSKPTR